MVEINPISLQSKASQSVSRLQCLSCGARCIGEPLLRWPVCPTCGANALILVERLPLDEPWWHLLSRLEVT